MTLLGVKAFYFKVTLEEHVMLWITGDGAEGIDHSQSMCNRPPWNKLHLFPNIIQFS